MLAIAGKRLAQTDVALIQASATHSLPLPDKSFDIAISSYTIHGVKAVKRQKMSREMSRLAKHHVIFHDYNEKRAWLTDLVERLEGSDYLNFIQNGELEMKETFKDVTVLNVGAQTAWYVCTPYGTNPVKMQHH